MQQFEQIPSVILNDITVLPKTAALYGIILGLSKKLGYCYACNDTLASYVGRSKRTVQRMVMEMLDKGWIKVDPKKGRNRLIYPLVKVGAKSAPTKSTTPVTKVVTPQVEKKQVVTPERPFLVPSNAVGGDTNVTLNHTSLFIQVKTNLSPFTREDAKVGFLNYKKEKQKEAELQAKKEHYKQAGYEKVEPEINKESFTVPNESEFPSVFPAFLVAICQTFFAYRAENGWNCNGTYSKTSQIGIWEKELSEYPAETVAGSIEYAMANGWRKNYYESYLNSLKTKEKPKDRRNAHKDKNSFTVAELKAIKGKSITDCDNALDLLINQFYKNNPTYVISAKDKYGAINLLACIKETLTQIRESALPSKQANFPEFEIHLMQAVMGFLNNLKNTAYSGSEFGVLANKYNHVSGIIKTLKKKAQAQY